MRATLASSTVVQRKMYLRQQLCLRSRSAVVRGCRVLCYFRLHPSPHGRGFFLVEGGAGSLLLFELLSPVHACFLFRSCAISIPIAPGP
jgi:hypothetical protein